MLFSHDTEHSLACIVDLVNSAPTSAGAEQLHDLDTLRSFVVNHDVSEVGRLTPHDLAEVHSLRTAIAAVFDATTDSSAAGAVNALVSQATVTPRLTDHDGYDWHVHYFAPGASIADHLAADCGMALAFFVVAGEQERLRRCEAPDCRHAFVDVSRNRSRRYCDSRTCGNRLHVAAYRARRKESAG